ncbi:MAG: OprO/OprP family phosphate-selective porin [Bacteroidales bacterium]|nr:OprO/OprP family phosphate-selective porin [Bacteroidales bacterium]
MRKLFLLTIGLMLTTLVYSQDKTPWVTLSNLKLSTRADFTLNYHPAHDTVASSSDHGFAGKYLVVALDGTLGSRFSYHLRQRLNTPNIGFANTFFQGTDWAYLDWNFTDNLFLSAGKQVVAIGGWEYDSNPIDIYYGTEFWNTVCCYEVGASLNYKDNSGKNHFLLQMSNSPFIRAAMESIYAYNLMWYGNFGIFKTAYSVNMIEYQPGKFINYIALGNKLQFNGVETYLDVINRASFEQDKFFGQDITAIYGIGVDIGPKWIVFAKAGLDFNQAQLPNTEAYDQYVTPGKRVDFESLGFEFYPMGDRSLRLHLCGSHTNVDGVNMFQANLGLTWKVDLLHSKLLK